MKIVVRIPNWIGDVIFALPALESLKANYPHAEVWIAAHPWVKDLFFGTPYAGRIIAVADGNSFSALRAAAKSLQSQMFDVGLLLTNSLASALLFSLAKIPERWGYRRDGRGFLLTKRVPPGSPGRARHMVFHYLQLLEGLGLRTLTPEIRLPVSAEEKEGARNSLRALGLDPEKKFALLAPGAAYGPAKRWPAAKFTALAGRLREQKKLEVLLVGAEGDSPLAEEVASALDPPAPSLAGKTSLRQLLALIGEAAVFISNDTGPVHMANALRIPVVAVFGPTDPRVTAPFHEPATVVKRDDIPCWPCSYRACPYDHRCLDHITADEVFSAAAAYLP
jgi:heptosyltransferase II